MSFSTDLLSTSIYQGTESDHLFAYALIHLLRTRLKTNLQLMLNIKNK